MEGQNLAEFFSLTTALLLSFLLGRIYEKILMLRKKITIEEQRKCVLIIDPHPVRSEFSDN